MRCPNCGEVEDRVVDSREVEHGAGIRRRRECLACHSRFTTFERVASPSLVVAKRSGQREPFEQSKLVAGIEAACKNRPVTSREVEAIAQAVEAQCRQGGGEVESRAIGIAVLERLRNLDEVAYLRFASVHKQFEDAEDFEREAGMLTGKPRGPKGAGSGD